MATRGVHQLKKLRFVYCEYGKSSECVREYIASGRIVEWARDHPHVEVEVKVRGFAHPYLEGTYLTGDPKVISVRNESPDHVQKVVWQLHNQSGRKVKRLNRPVITDTPSIQGIWTPMLDLQQTQFKVKVVEEE
mmetsp:Transcript_24682/g.36241  ORF Transcript_24682/g.36241 Transcript_24682/m.36241 type:complete len:134 (-) Transcript_24682:35-436(-)|eukprot:CAMPEP_0194049374 /NCGR_PEP_ID=MMETSP0009_2-20130614/30537_1 /TAXON_ID=210454 /ORGANISM="Grammatophora oceanica, Strain CCMP 410" /LENGTH=133 /DNA_ID=CAMNT_0038695515 /DNA_START=128 /DNA_END=529 /DNA_ORIENTATION=-